MKKPAKPGDGEEEAGGVHERDSGPAVQQQQQDQREQVVFRNIRLEKGVAHKQVFTIHYEKNMHSRKKHLSQLCHGASVNNLPKKGSLPNQSIDISNFSNFSNSFQFPPIFPIVSNPIFSHSSSTELMRLYEPLTHSLKACIYRERNSFSCLGIKDEKNEDAERSRGGVQNQVPQQGRGPVCDRFDA